MEVATDSALSLDELNKAQFFSASFTRLSAVETGNKVDFDAATK
jgi:hypothetical protein